MKKLLAIALAAAMTASLTACGEDAKITTAAPKEETTAGEEAAADAGEKKTGSEMNLEAGDRCSKRLSYYKSTDSVCR